jgi:hypothetical protein
MIELRADIAAASEQLTRHVKRSSGRALRAIETNLVPDEKVLNIAAGRRGKEHQISQRCLMVLTDRRVLFIHEGIVFRNQQSTPLRDISAVTVSDGRITITGLSGWNMKRTELPGWEIATTGAQWRETIYGVDQFHALGTANAIEAFLAR